MMSTEGLKVNRTRAEECTVKGKDRGATAMPAFIIHHSSFIIPHSSSIR
jgi:hypothetical protein